MRILASLAVALIPHLVGVTVDAQTSPPGQERPPSGAKGTKKRDGSRPKAPKGSKSPKGAKKNAKAPESTGTSAPKGLPTASTTPPRIPVDEKALARLAAQRWNELEKALLVELLAREPARAFEQPWSENGTRRLGTFGTGATLRWRRTLSDALAELGRIDTGGMQWQARAQHHALEDWVEAELVLLDGQMPSTSDPAGYVQRAFRALRAAREAAWMSAERRAAELESLLDELPAYFEDARLSLIDPSAPWIDLALAELDDLQELVSEIERDLPKKPVPRSPKGRKAAAAHDVDPRAALEAFRSWLLELRTSAAGRVPSLNAGDWQRLVSLTSGTAWTASELKARCLRELARLDLGARAGRAQRASVDAGADVAALAWKASARALGLGKAAHLLLERLEPEAVAFELETSARNAAVIARIAVDDGDSSRVFLAGPHGSWPPERALARSRELLSATALGVRYGLAGEALFALQDRTSKKSVEVLLDNRLVREGLGLYALDWTGRITRVENPFRGDEALALEFDFLEGLEAARLVAAIELHAEAIALGDVARGFARRTGVDVETARAEALAAARDPLHGLGYLGLIELQALEERLARLVGSGAGLKLGLLFASRHPDLRPSDAVRVMSSGSLRKAGGKKTTARSLENQGRTQQELSRSR